MSKAVSISEGGKGRIFPQTDKLKINNVGGGNSLWLPEDEVVTGTLYADENGIYLAENDGFSCYDTVVVRVEDETDPDDPDWELDPDELDEDVWDEESLEEFQEDPEAFEEKFNDKEKWKAEKAKKEKSQKIKKVKSLKPSKITGIDPVDGNPYQVGVDSEGNLTKEMLPSSIHIVVPPWKREYENGEEINFYGMHVYLLDKDGHPFKSEKYPTGEIPFDELVLPVTVASGGDNYQEAVIGKQSIKYQVGGSVTITGHDDTYDYDYSYTYSGADYLVCFDQGSTVLCLFVVTSPKNITRIFDATFDDGRHSEEVYPVSADRYTQINHIPYGYFSVAHSSRDGGIPWGIVEPPFENNPYSFGTVLLEGDTSGLDGNTIPVQWIRTDGEQLEDAFGIAVTNNVQSDISNSGSGHTGGGF